MQCLVKFGMTNGRRRNEDAAAWQWQVMMMLQGVFVSTALLIRDLTSLALPVVLVFVLASAHFLFDLLREGRVLCTCAALPVAMLP